MHAGIIFSSGITLKWQPVYVEEYSVRDQSSPTNGLCADFQCRCGAVSLGATEPAIERADRGHARFFCSASE
jgi:hypothetical protein